MASLLSLNSYKAVHFRAIVPQSQKAGFSSLKSSSITVNRTWIFSHSTQTPSARRSISVINKSGEESPQNNQQGIYTNSFSKIKHLIVF